MTEILINMHIMDAANVLLFVGSIVCASDYATSKHMLTTFDSSPENVSAIAGKTAILPCTVDLSNLDPTKEVCCCCCFRRRRRRRRCCCCCCCCCWWWWWCFYLTSFFKYFSLFYIRIMIKATQNNSRHTFFFYNNPFTLIKTFWILKLNKTGNWTSRCGVPVYPLRISTPY